MSFRIDQLAVLNLATVGNSITAGSFVKSGGTSSQFLKADGTVDSSAYITGITSGMVTTALGYTPVPNTRNITINGVTQDLSVDRTWTISAGVSSVTGSGSGISVSPTTGAVVISNTGVTSNVAGTGISVSGATGAVTITNTGVTSIVAGTAITISGATGAVTINNAGVTSVNGSTGALTGFATQAWVSSQGYITGNQTITLSGDVSGSGTTSISVTVNQIDGWSFVNTGSNSGTAADSINSNGISYVSANISLFGQTDGALYSQAYDSNWQHQIYGDYRTGQIAIRGKNNGTWQSWRTVLDSTNYSSIISGSFVQNILGDSGAYNLNTSGQQAFFRFSTGAWVNGPTTGNYSHVLSVNGATDNRTFQVYFGDVPGYLWWRPFQGNSVIHPWERILTSYNYNGWAPTLTGGGASGTWSINITGNADTVDNFHASQSTVANNIVVRDANGYIFGNYINMTDDGNPGGGTAISSFITKQGDNYYRSVSPTNAMVSIRGVASGSWGINVTGTAGSETLATVTGRGATTSTDVTFGANSTSDQGIRINYGNYVSGYGRIRFLQDGSNHSTIHSFSASWQSGTLQSSSSGAINIDGQNGVTMGAWNNPSMWIDNSGNAQSRGSMRSPIFYDSDNTAYYLNPASGSTSLRIAGGIAQNDIVGRPAAYWGSTGTTGAVVIKFPGTTGNYGMVHAVIDIYEYNGNDACTVIVGGHNWNGAWYSYGAQVVGSTDKPVRVGVKDGQYCIVIGNGSSSWSYGQVVLRKIQNGTYYSGVMDVAGGYTVAIESDTYSWISGDLRNLETPLNFYAGSNIYMGGNLVATQSWVTSQGYVTGGPFLPLAGGTMSGDIAFPNDSAVALKNASGTAGFRPDDQWGNIYTWNYSGGYYVDATAYYLRSASATLWMTITGSGTVEAMADMRAPIFYDSANTAYYCDPASTSVLNTISSYTIYNTSLGSGYYFTAGDWGWRHQTPSGWIQFGPANSGHAHIYTDRSNFYFNVDLLYLNGYIVPMYGYNRTGDLYASRYYDANDTGYYLDPNSESSLYRFTTSTYTRNGMNYLSINSPFSTRSAQSSHYQNGTMGWGTTDFNTIGSYWGSGFIDTWSNPGNAPGGSSHYVGMQGMHYNDQNGNFHGWQMACAQEATNRWFWRSSWNVPNRPWVEMIHSGNIGSQSVSYASSAGDADTVDGFHAAAFPYRSGGSSGYYQVADWMQFNTSAGLYWPSYYNAHIEPNTSSSYGSINIRGSKNGWAGINFSDSNNNLMVNSNESGIHKGGYGWQFRWYQGTLYCSRGTYGGGTEYTVWDSGNLTNLNQLSNGPGYITSSSNVVGLYSSGFGSSNFTWYQSPTPLSPYTGSWASYLVSNHGDGATYYNQTIVMPFWGIPEYFRKEGGTNRGPYQFFTSEHGSTFTYATNMNQYVRTSDNPTFGNIYSNGWFRNNNNNQGLYSENTTMHWSSKDNGYWDASSTTTVSSIRFWTGGHVSSLRGYVYANTSNEIGFLNSGGSWSLRMDNSGNATATGDVTAYSDARVKENVITVENALDKILNLRGVYYNRIDTEDKRRKVGVIAQEIMEVLPEVVGKDTDGMYNVAYGNIVGVLIEAIKEQQKQIDELKARLD